MGGGSTQQTTNTSQNSLANTISSFLNSATSGQTVSGNELQALTGSSDGTGTGGTQGYFQQMMQSGLSPAVINQANSSQEQGIQQGINQAVETQQPGGNTAGLVEDMNQQGLMSLANLNSQLGAQNQAAMTEGAKGVMANTAVANPLTNWSNSGGTQSQSGSQTSTGSSNSTTTQNPGFGQLLGSLLGAGAGAMTGGAASAGGLGSILGGL